MPVGLVGDAARRARVRVPRPPAAIAIPRIRDFRGLNPRSFDGRGNYSMGVREQIIFPEIDYDAIDQVRGLDITITTTAADRRGGVRAARGARACRSPARAPGPYETLDQEPLRPEEIRRLMAKTSKIVRQARPQVQDPGVHSLPPLRPPARRVPQVRPVPDLPARARPQRLHPRHDEVELVSDMSMTDPIADFLTRIRNAIKAAHETVEIPRPAAQARDGADPARAGLHRRASRSRPPARPAPQARCCSCA